MLWRLEQSCHLRPKKNLERNKGQNTYGPTAFLLSTDTCRNMIRPNMSAFIIFVIYESATYPPLPPCTLSPFIFIQPLSSFINNCDLHILKTQKRSSLSLSLCLSLSLSRTRENGRSDQGLDRRRARSWRRSAQWTGATVSWWTVQIQLGGGWSPLICDFVIFLLFLLFSDFCSFDCVLIGGRVRRWCPVSRTMMSRAVTVARTAMAGTSGMPRSGLVWSGFDLILINFE